MRKVTLALMAAGIVLGAVAARAEDALAVIKKAVAQAESPVAPSAKPVPTPKKAEPQWLRVRVEPKGEKKGRIKVNLPLAFVRAVGENLPLQFGDGCRGGRKESYCGMKLSEVLKTLDSGESLVEIEGEDESVRIWVE